MPTATMSAELHVGSGIGYKNEHAAALSRIILRAVRSSLTKTDDSSHSSTNSSSPGKCECEEGEEDAAEGDVSSMVEVPFESEDVVAQEDGGAGGTTRRSLDRTCNLPNLEADDLGLAAAKAHRTVLSMYQSSDPPSGEAAAIDATHPPVSESESDEQEREREREAELVGVIARSLLRPPAAISAGNGSSVPANTRSTTEASEGTEPSRGENGLQSFHLLSQMSTQESRVLIRLYHRLLSLSLDTPIAAAATTQTAVLLVPSLLEVGINRTLPWYVREESLRCLRKTVTSTELFATNQGNWNAVIGLVEGVEKFVVGCDGDGENENIPGSRPLTAESIRDTLVSSAINASAAFDAAATEIVSASVMPAVDRVPAQVRSAALAVLVSHCYTPSLSRLEAIMSTPDLSDTVDSKHPPKLVGWFDGVRQLTLARAVLGDVGCYSSLVTRLYDPSEGGREEARAAIETIGKRLGEDGSGCEGGTRSMAEIARQMILHDELLDENGEFPHFLQRNLLHVVARSTGKRATNDSTLADDASKYVSFSSVIGPTESESAVECSTETESAVVGCRPCSPGLESDELDVERQIWLFLREKHWNQCVVRWAGENMRTLDA